MDNKSIFGLNLQIDPIRIAFIGKQCSGKTTMANFMLKSYEKIGPGGIVKFADPIYETLNVLKKKKHRVFMQKFGSLAHECFGENIFVNLFNRKMREEYNEDFKYAIIVCDDVRRKFEFDAVKSHGFMAVYIETPVEIRRNRSNMLKLEFNEDHESELYIDELKELCDMQIKGNAKQNEMEDYFNAIRIFANTRQ